MAWVYRFAGVAMLAVGSMMTGCASNGDLRLVREPAMPAVAVAKAVPYMPFYKNVSIQEVQGAPEFRWFDGGAVLTTRPTRLQVLRNLTDHLDRADMLAPRRIDSDYMLYVSFDDLHGPDVWLGSDKLASARITFRLVEWRTGRLVKQKTIEASYRVKWVGVTPDIVRAAIAGPIGVTKDSAIAPVGGVLGGLIVGYYVNENLIVKIADVPLAGLYGEIEAGKVYDREALDGRELIGVDPATDLPQEFVHEAAVDGSGRRQLSKGFAASALSALAIGSSRGHFSDFEAMLAGGEILALGAAQGPITASRPTSASGQIGGFNGTERRYEATRGLLDLAFDEFMADLSQDGAVVYKQAVSCEALNSQLTGAFQTTNHINHQGAYLRETDSAYAINCPNSHYNDSKTTQAYPARF